jgi:hypothetical protein
MRGFLWLGVCLFFLFPTKSHAEIKGFDANGQFLGVYLGYFQGENVFIPSLNLATVISSYDGAIYAPVTVLFQSTDCTGTPFSYATQTNMVGCIGTDCYTGEHVRPTSFQYNSYWGSDGQCYRTEHAVQEKAVVPTKKVKLPFTAPVALPMHFEYQPQVQASSVPTVGTIGLIAASLLFSISAIIKIKRRDKLSTFEAIKRMVIFKM